MNVNRICTKECYQWTWQPPFREKYCCEYQEQEATGNYGGVSQCRNHVKVINYMNNLFFILLFPIIGISQKLSTSENLHFSKHALFEETNLFLHRKTASWGLSISFGDYARGNFKGETPYVLPEGIQPIHNGMYYWEYAYKSNNRGVGFGCLINNDWIVGYNKKNVFSIGAFIKYYIIKDDLTVFFKFPSQYTKPPDEPQTIVKKTTIKHESLSAGIYFGYKYSLTRKLKIITQLNMPYYYPVRTKVYFANQSEFPMVALESNLSIGLNYIMKK